MIDRRHAIWNVAWHVFYPLGPQLKSGWSLSLLVWRRVILKALKHFRQWKLHPHRNNSRRIDWFWFHREEITTSSMHSKYVFNNNSVLEYRCMKDTEHCGKIRTSFTLWKNWMLFLNIIRLQSLMGTWTGCLTSIQRFSNVYSCIRILCMLLIKRLLK